MTDLPCRDLFDLPDGVIYLDGNSLGPLPRRVRARLVQTVDAEWGAMLIRGWNDAQWMDLPERAGADGALDLIMDDIVEEHLPELPEKGGDR